MPLFKCKALLFDMDGTIIDSYEYVIRLWTTWGNRHGLDINHLLVVMPGLQTIDTIRLVAPHLDAQKEAETLQASEVSGFTGVRAYPGAVELLKSLPAGSWTIVTSATRKVAEARLRETGLPIPETLVTSEIVSHGKPAPDGFLVGAQRLGLSPAECIVLEDAVAGVKAGKAAGMRVIALATTQPANLLTAADAIIPSIQALSVNQSEDGLVVKALDP